MKAKLLLFGLGLLSFIVLISSCDKTTETPVQPASLLFNPDSTSFTGQPGETRSFQISASAPSGFVSLVVDKTVGTGSPVELANYPDDNADNVVVQQFTYTFDTTDVGQTVVLTITLSETGTAGVTKMIDVTTNPIPSPTARSYTAVLLYAPLGNLMGESFFSTNTGATYSPDSITNTSTALSPDIDFGYYYGTSNHASLASPEGFTSTVFSGQVAGWNTLNDITFKLTDITPSQYTEMSTFADIDDAYAAGSDPTTPNILTQLAADQVIAFATDPNKDGGSKKGLIMVSEISGTTGSNDYIKLEILVQEPAE